MLGSARAHTDAVELHCSTKAMRATPLSPSPPCRRLVAEPDSLKLNPWRHVRHTSIASLDGPCSMLCRAMEEVRWGAAWACHDTCSVRSYRATGVLRNPRICAVVQKRRRRGGHLPQGSVGDQLVCQTRLRGVGRCRRRGKTWPDSTVASRSTAASRSRRTRMSIKPVKLEWIVSKFALEIVPEDQHAARSM